MDIEKHHTKSRPAVILGTMIGLTVISLFFGLAWPVMVTQAGPTLPPRETATPGSDKGDKRDDNDPLLAHIELFASTAPAGAWSVVQWQDSSGNWHDVEGWRGTLETGGYRRWAVEAKDFGTGPFRWQIRQGGPNGTVLGTSETFTLPMGANEIVKIMM